ncbi:hypothetical protein L596_004761 [Steinernema carpocapsae]|uniref:Uncharacterized protein n=1 Tax=Steinernema carpocapsae TaxID=34508 RepID=A0A4U8V0Z3_STECR|nr:hypothetical protein L596_004761 [Steinernema carpocapsae]
MRQARSGSLARFVSATLIPTTRPQAKAILLEMVIRSKGFLSRHGMPAPPSYESHNQLQNREFHNRISTRGTLSTDAL